MRSRQSARLARPVSGSCSAWWRIRSSVCSREKAIASTLATACRNDPSSSPNASSRDGGGHERAVDLIAGVDRHADAADRRLVRAPGRDLLRPVEDRHAVHPQRRPDALRGLLAQLLRADAAQRTLAERRHRRLLLRLAPQARVGVQALGDVAPDREQQRSLVGLDDAPAHLADEVGAVLATPVRPGREAQRVLELPVELEVAAVAGAHVRRPQHLDRPADQLVAGVAELRLRERVDEGDQAVAAGADGRVGQALEHRPEGDLRVRHSQHG